MTRFAASLLAASTLLIGTGTARASAQPVVARSSAMPFFCPRPTFTRWGVRTMCRTHVYRASMDGSAVLWFPTILARGADGTIYYTRTVKVSRVAGVGLHTRMVKLGEQRDLGPLSIPDARYDNGVAHWTWEPLSELMSPTFGGRRMDSDAPIHWACNTSYLFSLATGRGDVDGMAQLTLSC